MTHKERKTLASEEAKAIVARLRQSNEKAARRGAPTVEEAEYRELERVMARKLSAEHRSNLVAAVERVVSADTVFASEDVISVAAIEDVAPATAEQLVSAFQSHEEVVAIPALENVSAVEISADEEVVSRPTDHNGDLGADIVIFATRSVVGLAVQGYRDIFSSRRVAERVLPSVRIERIRTVGPRECKHNVIVGAACEEVIAKTAGQLIVPSLTVKHNRTREGRPSPEAPSGREPVAATAAENADVGRDRAEHDVRVIVAVHVDSRRAETNEVLGVTHPKTEDIRGLGAEIDQKFNLGHTPRLFGGAGHESSIFELNDGNLI